MVEFNKRARIPKPTTQFIAGHQCSGMLQQNPEQIQGLVLQFEAKSLLAEFVAIQIDFKEAEANYPGWSLYLR